jgi:hypothetical protein
MLIQRTASFFGSFDDVNYPAPGQTLWNGSTPGTTDIRSAIISCGWDWQGDTSLGVPQMKTFTPAGKGWTFNAVAAGDHTDITLVLTYYVETEGAAADIPNTQV